MQTSESFKQEIIDLEKKYWAALRDQDLDSALNMTDFPGLVISSRGVMPITKDGYVKMFNSGQGRVRDFKIDEERAKVIQAGPDTAVIAYSVHSRFGKKDDDVKDIDAINTSTWVKKNGQWMCSMHTETELSKNQ
jgi:ketosteroid isomerase-like protein